MNFIYYPKCSTCQKAKKWLDEKEIPYTERHIVEDNPSYDELKEWYGKSGLPLKRFFNTSGLKYKELKLNKKEIKDILNPTLYIGRSANQAQTLVNKIRPLLKGAILEADEIKL